MLLELCGKRFILVYRIKDLGYFSCAKNFLYNQVHQFDVIWDNSKESKVKPYDSIYYFGTMMWIKTVMVIFIIDL